jgi:hypothetical protein
LSVAWQATSGVPSFRMGIQSLYGLIISGETEVQRDDCSKGTRKIGRTNDFCRSRQKQVAEIVHCGEPTIWMKSRKATRWGGLSFVQPTTLSRFRQRRRSITRWLTENLAAILATYGHLRCVVPRDVRNSSLSGSRCAEFVRSCCTRDQSLSQARLRTTRSQFSCSHIYVGKIHDWLNGA